MLKRFGWNKNLLNRYNKKGKKKFNKSSKIRQAQYLVMEYDLESVIDKLQFELARIYVDDSILAVPDDMTQHVLDRFNEFQ